MDDEMDDWDDDYDNLEDSDEAIQRRQRRFQDVRFELRSSGGHNLTSVLMNPRESLMGELFDEFSQDLAAPVDLLSHSHPHTQSLLYSQHSKHNLQPTNSSHHPKNGSEGSPRNNNPNFNPNLSSSSHSTVSSTTTHTVASPSAALHQLTRTESEQLAQFLQRLKSQFTGYRPLTSSASSSGVGSMAGSAEELRACYREIPDCFLKPDFALTHPATFAEVCGTPPDPAGVASQLSCQLDLVEVALLKQIWARSPAFFRSLDDMKQLQGLVARTILHIQSTRVNLAGSDQAATHLPAMVPKMHRRARNCSQLHEKMFCMQQVLQAKQAIASLVEVEDYMTALELIHSARQVFHREQLSSIASMRVIGSQLDDFDGKVCQVMCSKFVSLAIQWEEDAESFSLSQQQGNSLEPLDPDVEPVGNPSGPKAVPASSQEPLRALLRSLLQTSRLDFALNMYRTRLLDALKLIIRTCVLEYLTHFDPAMMVYDDYPGAGEDDAAEGESAAPSSSSSQSSSSSSFSQRVKEMTADNFLSCLSMCFENVLLSLTRAEVFHRFVEASLLRLSCHNTMGSTANATGSTMASAMSNTMGSPVVSIYSQVRQNTNPNPKSDGVDEDNNSSSVANSAMGIDGEVSAENIGGSTSGEVGGLIAASKSCLSAACELAQRSIAQLLTLRKDTTARQLSLEKVKFLWEISLHFVSSVEQLAGCSAYILRQCLLSHTKAFLDHLHETSKGRLVNTLDNERWVQCDVSIERQQEINRLAGGKTLLSPSVVADPLDHSSNPNSLLSPAPSSSASTSVKSKSREMQPVTVDAAGEFRVCWSVLLLVEIIVQYLEVASCFPPVTAEVIGKAAGLLRLFDSRTRVLVLGAQAIQSAARLKSISAKHLAITGQSLGLVIALLPHLRTALLAQIPPKHHMLLTELDRVSHELIEHHSQIVAKFVAIVGDFVDGSASKLRAVDWDRCLGGTSQLNGSNNSNCEYFDEVQRNVLALHRVLQSLLPSEQLQDVFFRIFALLNRKIPQHFEEVMPSTPTGRQRIMDEVTHMVLALSRLKQVDGSSLQSLEETFKRRYMR